jgi:glycosyltransferase involved in cell wall biosynthesis
MHSVTAYPRILADSIDCLPDKLEFSSKGANNKIKYILNLFNDVFSNSTKIDLLICGHLNLLPLAWLLSLYFRVPLGLILHGVEAWKPSSKPLSNFLLRYVDYLISVSDITLARFQLWASLRETKTFILPNSVQLQYYSPGLKPEDLLRKYDLEAKKVLLTLGRLDYRERYKGFDEVIDVLPDLVFEDPRLVYIVAGDGPDRKRLEAKVHQLKLDRHVIFTGFISEHRKADYYRLADAFVMPSRGEGFGIVLLEAMACGIPVMASKLDGSSEALLNGKLGLLVDPTNPEEVKAGIREILKQPKSIPQGLEYFSFENFERRCHQILDDLLGNNKLSNSLLEPDDAA